MINFKKIGVLGLSALATFAFASSVNAESLWSMSDYQGDGEELKSEYKYDCPGSQDADENGQCTGYNTPSLNNRYLGAKATEDGQLGLESFYGHAANPRSNFSVKITATDIDPSKNYIVKYDAISLGTSISKKYTGDELLEGVRFTIDIVVGDGILSVTEEGSTTDIKYDYQYNKCWFSNGDPNCVDEYLRYKNIYLKFSNYYQELVDLFNSKAPNGVIYLNTLEPTSEDFADSMITVALRKIFPEEYEVYGGFAWDESTGKIDKTKAYLDLSKGEDENHIYQTFDVKYIFLEKDEEIAKKVAEVAKKLEFDMDELHQSMDKWFILQDLEVVNYLYNSQKAKKFAEEKLPNYSAKIHALTDDDKIDFAYDPRAGSGSETALLGGALGPMNIAYDGVIYETVEPVGFITLQVLYVPDNTEKSKEAFIAAAKERLKAYLKGVNIDVKEGGSITALDEEDYKYCNWDRELDQCNYINVFDLDKTVGEWFEVTIGEQKYRFVISLGSDKMNNPVMKTEDNSTKIAIETESYDAPLDSRINAKKLAKNSAEYKALAQKLKILDEMSFELKLFSGSLNAYVETLADGSFKVYIPIDSKYAKKNLIAAYLKEDGSIEFHPITVKNGYAIFETTHFSTYSIVESNNPTTGDNIFVDMIVLVLSAGAIILLNRKFFLSK